MTTIANDNATRYPYDEYIFTWKSFDKEGSPIGAIRALWGSDDKTDFHLCELHSWSYVEHRWILNPDIFRYYCFDGTLDAGDVLHDVDEDYIRRCVGVKALELAKSKLDIERH